MKIKDIKKYVDQHRRTYLTEEFAYSSYNSPNTTYQVSNKVDTLLLTLDGHSIKLWHLCLTLVKRNSNPVASVSFCMRFEDAFGVLSRNYYYKSLKVLIDNHLIYETQERFVYVINIGYANKLYKPKLEDE